MSLKDKLMKKRAGVPMAGVFLLVILMVTAGGVGALMVHEGDKLATTEHNPIVFDIHQNSEAVTQGEWADAQANIENPWNATYTVTVDYFLEHNLDAKDIGLACNVTVQLPTGDYINGDDLLDTIYTSTNKLGMDDSVVEDFKIIYHGPAVNQTLSIELMGDVTVDKIHGPECPLITEDDVFNLTVNFNGELGEVVKDGEPASDGAVQEYDAGTQVILNATPNDGMVFTGWSGDVESYEYEITVTMNSDKTVTANFMEAPEVPDCDLFSDIGEQVNIILDCGELEGDMKVFSSVWDPTPGLPAADVLFDEGEAEFTFGKANSGADLQVPTAFYNAACAGDTIFTVNDTEFTFSEKIENEEVFFVYTC
ncbi:hypothetical protein AMET1_1369 [Methanonatronarchaeum thermophilum]|uniref:Bacterial repeat domain-containing protein n=1 Tax=Methanonatronarchaeum thermophilum TaxID=1927129 RepID=A0A1Y3GDR4_9EURY|nr:hypothetical protein [Methanonatronarchaeum thermophilum]OUJ18453.1 hypothetical protein AMET1_1369 [Methanonatronarchaeum thermophilum]